MQIVTNLVLKPYKGIPFTIPIFPLLTYIFAQKMASVFTWTVCSSALLDFGHSNTINMKGWQFYNILRFLPFYLNKYQPEFASRE